LKCIATDILQLLFIYLFIYYFIYYTTRAARNEYTHTKRNTHKKRSLHNKSMHNKKPTNMHPINDALLMPLGAEHNGVNIVETKQRVNCCKSATLVIVVSWEETAVHL